MAGSEISTWSNDKSSSAGWILNNTYKKIGCEETQYETLRKNSIHVAAAFANTPQGCAYSKQ